jgi:chemotaxis protein MotB
MRALFSNVTLAALLAGCATTAPRLPALPADASPELTASHDQVSRAYDRCALAYEEGGVPFQTWLTAGAGTLSLALFSASATAAFTAGDENVAGGAVAGLGLASIGAAGVATYFGAQIPGALERRATTGAVLESARAETQVAVDDKRPDRVAFIARQLYEDCRAIAASRDGAAATVVLQDFQRYRRDLTSDTDRFETVRRTRDDLAAANAKMSEGLADARVQNETLGRRVRGLELDAAEHEAEMNKMRGRLSELEEDRAKLSARERKLLEEKRKLEAQKSHFSELTEALKGEVEKGRVALRKLKNGVVVEMPGKVLFPSGKVELDEQGSKTLEKVAAALKDIKDRRFRVEGHTDDVPLSKRVNFKDNWELSAERALTVARFLRDHGVQPARLSAEGRAFYSPVASNKTKEGRARNRRIEIFLVPLGDG